MRCQAIVITAALVSSSGCFPTYQSPRVEPGYQTVGAVTVIGNWSQGINTPNVMATISPSYGFGRRFEIGVPTGMTLSPADKNGQDGHEILMVSPYAKLALNPADSKEHVAVILQTAVIVPTSIGVRYGHEAGDWEPQLGLSYIGTSTGDESIGSDRRTYQSYSLWMASVGAEYIKSPTRPACEIGLLLGNHEVGSPRRVSDVDLFVGFRVGGK